MAGFFFFLNACASTTPARKEMAPSLQGLMEKEIESSGQLKAMNERLLLSAISSKRDLYRDYKIGPEDLLEISVFEDEKLNKTVRVSSQGNISLPLIGVLRVKGLTANELEREVRDLLAEKYFKDPHVSVFIKEYRNQQISVIGAVEKPGVYEVRGQKTVLDMLAMAGGLSTGGSREAAGSLLFLIRPPRPDEEGPHQTFVIDLEQLLIKGDMDLNLALTHGDVLNIPVSGKIFVGGEVRRPGGFSLKGQRMTVSQAIAMAEGVKPTADGAEAKIFRNLEKGHGKEIITVNIYTIEKGQAEDPFLKENDIIIVPKSGVKTFLIEFRDTIKGLIGFGFSLGGL